MSSLIIANLFKLLEDYGVRHIVCSPGSRNAPLLYEAHQRERIQKHIVVDERSAAFIGLGIAMITRKPVALICTSGSAVLNYAPAVAEAFYQSLPLIVISADRPVEWINQDDSQTIKQTNVLSNFVKASYNFDGDRFEKNYVWYANRIINEGLITADDDRPGPVHFNIHLEGEVCHELTESNAKKIVVNKPLPILDKNDINFLAELCYDKKIMIVAGFMPPDNKLQKAMMTLERLPNICIMAETVSNLHLSPECYIIDPALFPLQNEDPTRFVPDIVISLGGALISRKLKEFIRKNKPPFHISINSSESLIDCFQAVTHKLQCNPASFLKSFGKRLIFFQNKSHAVSRYRDLWNNYRKDHYKKISSFSWSDLRALDSVLKALPECANLLLSNGTAVRYAQILPYRNTHATYSNRGVSGIEGSTSTAIGASLVYNKITCLITGDMSFRYDMAGITSGLESEKLRIIVLDNGGGDIFRFIAATKNLTIREKYLCVERKFPIENIVKSFGWEYYYANSIETLEPILKIFFKEGRNPRILHLDTTSTADNAVILSKFLS